MSLYRRTWLKQVSLGAGGLLLRPMLGQLFGGEDRAQRKPWRVVFIMQANGFQEWAAQPKNLPLANVAPEKTVDLPLADYDLSDDMEPLKEYKRLVTVVQRLHGSHASPFHSAKFGALSGVGSQRAAVAPTIDATLARLNPATYPNVNLGVATGKPYEPVNDGIMRICSAWDKDKPIGTQIDPNLAYKALFGEAAAKIDEGGGLMDEIADDVKQVTKRLSAADRERFAKYLDVFESLDQRKELFRKSEESKGIAEEGPKVDDIFSSTLAAKKLTAQFELATAALVSGLTNVATIASGACQVHGQFGGLDVDDVELHQVGHFRNYAKSWQSIYTTIRKFHFKLIAGMIDKLNQVSDADGTPLMSNTLIVYTSDGAETHHSKGDQWPFVLIGNLNGALRTGRYLAYPAPGQPGRRPINALYSTLLKAAGEKNPSFNPHDKGGKAEDFQPLAELLG